MNIKNGYSWAVGFIIGIFALHGNAAESWDVGNNSVTYSVFQDNFELGEDDEGNILKKSVLLSQLDLNEVATREGVGTAADYTLSSVVLSMNGTVYGTIKVTNTGASSVTPRYRIDGDSMLTYDGASTPAESYYSTIVFPAINPGDDYTMNANVVGSVTPTTLTITEDLLRFLGEGTIETMGAFPVYGTFTTGGTMVLADIALQGMADISITNNYVPEPSSVALLTMGFAALALRRKRKTV